MLKICITCLFLFSSVFAISADALSWKSLGGETGSQATIEIIQADLETMVVEITIPGFYMYDYPAGGFTFDRIELPGYYNQNEIGLPELPLIPSLFLLPSEAKPVLSIEEVETSTFENINVLPTQEPEIDMPHAPFPFRMNEEFYSSCELFPEYSALVDNEGIWAGVSVARLVINPFSFNPSLGELTVISRIRIRIDFEGASSEMFTVPRERLPMFRYSLINFEQMEYLFDTSRSLLDGPEDPAEYIVVCNEETVEDAADLFLTHNALGLKTTVVILSNPATTSEVKSAIQDNFVSGVTRFALIVGDYIELPPYIYSDFVSDYYFSLLEGSDNYPDIGVGRLSRQESVTGQIINQVGKIIDGYMLFDFSSLDTPGVIPSTTVLCAHEEDYPGKYTLNCEQIAAQGYSQISMTFTKLYAGAGGVTAAQLQGIINDHIGVVLYRGHGQFSVWQWSPGWNKNHINALTNTFMPIVFNIACLNGMFNSAPACLCESWQWADGGASGNLGASTGSYTSPNDAYSKRIFKSIYDYGNFRIGETLMNANTHIIDLFGTYGLKNARMYVWFGDPAQDVWTFDIATEPGILAVDAPERVNIGSVSFDITVTKDGTPAQGINVTLTDGVEGYGNGVAVYEEAVTNASGQVTFDIYAPMGSILKVGAYEHDMIHDIAEIIVGEEGVETGEPVLSIFGLMMPVPNPVTMSANISFNLSSSGNIELEVYDVTGRKIDTVFSGNMSTGTHNLVWQPGEQLTSGVYFIRLTSGTEISTRQVMVIK